MPQQVCSWSVETPKIYPHTLHNILYIHIFKFIKNIFIDSRLFRLFESRLRGLRSRESQEIIHFIPCSEEGATRDISFYGPAAKGGGNLAAGDSVRAEIKYPRTLTIYLFLYKKIYILSIL